MKLTSDSKDLPWEGRPSIYEYVKSHLKNGMIYADDRDLPDNAPLRTPWGEYDPGCDDYFDIFDGGDSDSRINPKYIKHLVDLFTRYSQNAKIEDKIKFYNLLKDNPVACYWDHFLNSLSDKKIPITEHSIELTRWMVQEAPDREVVKVGIILMGILRNPEDLLILQTLGRHDEFTYYVANALFEMTPMWDIVLIDIIKSTSNFGRVMSVNFLITNTEREESRKWCIRHGFQNFYFPDMILVSCLEYGNVLKDLRQPEWDEPLLHAIQVMVEYILRSVKPTHAGMEDEGEILYQYVKQTVGKKRGYVQYLLLKKFMDFFEKVQLDFSLLECLSLSEEKYCDIWIEVNNEVKKKWFQNIKNNKKYFETYPYDIEGRCRQAYDKLLDS